MRLMSLILTLGLLLSACGGLDPLNDDKTTPRGLSYRLEGTTLHLDWVRVFGASQYTIYIDALDDATGRPDTSIARLVRTINATGYEIRDFDSQRDYVVRITATVNGTESEPSQALIIRLASFPDGIDKMAGQHDTDCPPSTSIHSAWHPADIATTRQWLERAMSDTLQHCSPQWRMASLAEAQQVISSGRLGKRLPATQWVWSRKSNGHWHGWQSSSDAYQQRTLPPDDHIENIVMWRLLQPVGAQ